MSPQQRAQVQATLARQAAERITTRTYSIPPGQMYPVTDEQSTTPAETTPEPKGNGRNARKQAAYRQRKASPEFNATEARRKRDERAAKREAA